MMLRVTKLSREPKRWESLFILTKKIKVMVPTKKPDIVVMVHPDYQYDAKLVGVLCESIVNGRADVMLGSRIQTRRQVLAGGMPLWKYFANRFLTLVENLAMGL